MSEMNLNVGVRGLKQCTNIMDLKVPEFMKIRRSTGIDWMDDALGASGGMIGSQVMMLTGSPGVGKTTLFLQLANAITEAGHQCLVNTGEESLYQVKMTVERLGLKSGFVCGQDVMVSSLIEHGEAVMKAHPGKQLFVLHDSLQTLNDGKYKDGGTTGNTPVRCTEMLTSWAKKERSKGQIYPIVIFIGQATKNGDFAGKNTIRHAIDTHAQIYFDEDKKSPTWGERLFEVTKNRFGCNGKTYVLGMEKKGLIQRGVYDKTARDE